MRLPLLMAMSECFIIDNSTKTFRLYVVPQHTFSKQWTIHWRQLSVIHWLCELSFVWVISVYRSQSVVNFRRPISILDWNSVNVSVFEDQSWLHSKLMVSSEFLICISQNQSLLGNRWKYLNFRYQDISSQ